MKISIVIPTYNSEKYIARCLDSVLAQEERDFEAIVVNDGSKDKTAVLVEEYVKKDKRIILINQENGGVSKARNTGLDRAQGEYIFFVDSDDWIPTYALSNALRAIQESDADIVMAKMWHRDVKTGNLKEHNLNEPLAECAKNPQTEDAFLKILTGYALKKGVAYSALAKLYKREIIEKYSVRFEEGLAYCEDVVFNVDYLSNVSSACVVDAYYYCAEDNVGSLTKRYKPQVVDATILSYERFCELFKEKGIGGEAFQELEEQLLNSLWDIVFRVLSGKYVNVTKREYKKIVFDVLERPIFVKLSQKHRKNGRVCASSMTAKIAKKAYGKGHKGTCYSVLRLFIGIRRMLGRK